MHTGSKRARQYRRSQRTPEPDFRVSCLLQTKPFDRGPLFEFLRAPKPCTRPYTSCSTRRESEPKSYDSRHGKHVAAT